MCTPLYDALEAHRVFAEPKCTALRSTAARMSRRARRVRVDIPGRPRLAISVFTAQPSKQSVAFCRHQQLPKE